MVLVRPVFGDVGRGMLLEFADCLARLPEEARALIVGSVKLAMALVVLSRAKAAKVNKPVRFDLLELVVDRVDCRFLKVAFRSLESVGDAVAIGESPVEALGVDVLTLSTYGGCGENSLSEAKVGRL